MAAEALKKAEEEASGQKPIPLGSVKGEKKEDGAGTAEGDKKEGGE